MNNDSETFSASAEQFFNQDSTWRSLRSIAQAKRLVIYCGAGVSIDRTGMAWGQLLGSVFAPTPTSHPDYPSDREIELLRAHEDPVRLASVLVQYSVNEFPSAEAFKRHVVPLLQNNLYKAELWRNGRLMGAVCRLAIFWSALPEREVHIVTTNYDTYLESEFLKECGRTEIGIKRVKSADADRNNLSPITQPDLMIWVRDVDSDREFGELVKLNERKSGRRKKSDPIVHLHYLHGRVHQEGAGAGHIVLSEEDYALTRVGTLQTLQELFSDEPAVLILGASLTDPPLIDSLALTKPEPNPQRVSAPSKRFAVMPRGDFSRYDQELDADLSSRIVGHLAKRCEHLGTQLLVPDFRFQTAQFVEELTLGTILQDDAIYRDSKNGNRYGLRLLDWWNMWKETELATDPLKMYEVLRWGIRDELSGFSEILQLLKEYTPSSFGTAKPEETFRLELWIRDDPAKFRRLSMWASTAGPVFDGKAMKSATLKVASTNATVRAFCEGRPQHFDRSDLSLGRGSGSKWESFISMPVIYLNRGGNAPVPVGAITLASSLSKQSSALPLVKQEAMKALKRDMLDIGRYVLAPRND